MVLVTPWLRRYCMTLSARRWDKSRLCCGEPVLSVCPSTSMTRLGCFLSTATAESRTSSDSGRITALSVAKCTRSSLMVQPHSSTTSPFGVFGQRSMESGTPSPSLSKGGGGGGGGGGGAGAGGGGGG